MKFMFYEASSFNQNLCPWGPKLPSNFDYVNFAGAMFSGSGCANKNKPTGSTGPWCAVTNCPTAIPSLSPTESPTASPTASLSQSPTTQYCFPDRATLKNAVDNYISEGCETNPSCATRSQYGLIGTWCVKHVTDMNTVFWEVKL